MSDNIIKIRELVKQKNELIEEKEYTMSQDKLDFLDGEIYELEDTINILKGYDR